jgi:hypothetical protein
VRLTFLGKESTPDQSPTLYATDEYSFVVQGWLVTDPEVVAAVALTDDETIVEVPPELMHHLGKAGLPGDVTNLVPPIVHVTTEGTYIVKGRRVHDSDTLAQMHIPDNETCVEVTRSAVAALVGG